MIHRSLVFLSLTAILSCDPIDDRLEIVNKSLDTIFYSFSPNDSIGQNPLRILNNDTLLGSSNIILPNSSYKHGLIGPNEWEYYINRDCNDSILRIFILEKELVFYSNWDSIVKNQLYSKKFNMSVEDLEKQNWKVIYGAK